MSDIVERIRQMVRERLSGYHDPGICAELTGAADEIETWRQQYEDSVAQQWGTETKLHAAEVEIARLRKGIQDYLDGNYEHPHNHRSELGNCKHDVPWYAECVCCDCDHFTAVLSHPHASGEASAVSDDRSAIDQQTEVR